MITEENTRALVLYVPPKKKFNIKDLYEKLSLYIGHAVKARIKAWAFFYGVHLFSVFLSCGMMFNDYSRLVLGYDLFFKIDSAVILSLNIIVFLTGFTLYGRAVALIYDYFFGIIVATLVCRCLINREMGIVSSLVWLLMLSVTSFAVICFSSEVFVSSKASCYGIKEVIKKGSLVRYTLTFILSASALQLIFYYF